jgi:hypothetical protein
MNRQKKKKKKKKEEEEESLCYIKRKRSSWNKIAPSSYVFILRNNEAKE